MKFLRCNLQSSMYPQWGWPTAKLIHQLRRLMLRLTPIDEVDLSSNRRGVIVPHDMYLESRVIILQNLPLNTVITKCKILRIMNADPFFGTSYLFNPLDNGSSFTQGLRRFVHRNDSPDRQYKRNSREFVHFLLALLRLCNRLRSARWKLML